MKQEEFEKVSDILKEILGYHMHGGEVDEVLAELDEQVQDAGLITVIYNELKSFKPGEIICAVETEDYAACLFRMPDDYKGEDSMMVRMFVKSEVYGWQDCGIDRLYIEDDQTYRRATKEEIALFNKEKKD